MCHALFKIYQRDWNIKLMAECFNVVLPLLYLLLLGTPIGPSAAEQNTGRVGGKGGGIDHICLIGKDMEEYSHGLYHRLPPLLVKRHNLWNVLKGERLGDRRVDYDVTPRATKLYLIISCKAAPFLAPLSSSWCSDKTFPFTSLLRPLF